MTTALPALIRADETNVFPRYLDWAYPNIERAEGVRLFRTDGTEILDACGAGAMVACLGHGRLDIVDAAARQADQLSYVYYHAFTNERQEELADRVIEVAAPEMARARFVTGGSEANEMALRLARAYHAERGDSRWRIVSPAQSYHGSTLGTLALTGRHSLRHPYGPYLAGHLHIPPSVDTGEAALAELDRILAEAGDSVAAFLCEPVSAASLPGYSPPQAFWEGLAERRDRHGFLVVFDEVVTGFGRTGSWFAYHQIPLVPDIVTFGKTLGAGYAPLAGILCAEHVYEAIASGSREFEHGHTWDGAPLLCQVGLAVVAALENERLVERVSERGPALRDEFEDAVGGLDLVREVRGRGFLLGIELGVPATGLVDEVMLDHGVLVLATHSGADGFTGDHVLVAPAYNAPEAELAEMVERIAAALTDVQNRLA
ncbi:MAG TPA: aminotransferase class III-fold pyridoxal phosphate-dependent enzyme [Gaiellaceae bacterium]|nr:aminotransferase class III-fold pyridoxal phosphate-dependent enzyme [Gaiellaceae bacterium]